MQQYIRHHWDRRSSKFTEPQIGDEEKQLIKQQIPACLGDAAPRIRTTTVSDMLNNHVTLFVRVDD